MQDITLRIWRNFPPQGVEMLKREGYKIKWDTNIPETGTHLVIVWHEHALAFQRQALRSQRFPEAYVVKGGAQDWLPPDWQTFFLGPLMVVPTAVEEGPTSQSWIDHMLKFHDAFGDPQLFDRRWRGTWEVQRLQAFVDHLNEQGVVHTVGGERFHHRGSLPGFGDYHLSIRSSVVDKAANRVSRTTTTVELWEGRQHKFLQKVRVSIEGTEISGYLNTEGLVGFADLPPGPTKFVFTYEYGRKIQ
jgi:hypothetical protein